MLQYLINRRRPNEGLQLAEERIEPDEEASLDSIITQLCRLHAAHLSAGHLRARRQHQDPRHRPREVAIRDDLPAHMRHGIFAEPRTFPAYVRFSGPGPDLPADIDDAGFVSMAVKLMDVPGPKLMDDEKHTQDLICVCTPDLRHAEHAREREAADLELPRHAGLLLPQSRSTPHLLDFLMQGLWNETQYNPLGTRYWSCVPYLLGEGQAMMYSFLPSRR